MKKFKLSASITFLILICFSMTVLAGVPNGMEVMSSRTQGEKLVLEARYMFGGTAEIKDVDANNYMDIIIKDGSYLLGEVMESKGYFKYVREHGEFIQLSTLNIAGISLSNVNIFDANCNRDICNAFIKLANKKHLNEVTLNSLKGKFFRGSLNGITYTISFKEDDIATTPIDILRKTIKYAQTLNSKDYSSEAYKGIENAIVEGEAVANKINSSANDIEKAIQNIWDAIEKANSSKDKTKELKSILSKLPETEEAASKMIRSQLQPLLENYETKVKESAVPTKEIRELPNYSRLSIAKRRMADIAHGKKVYTGKVHFTLLV